MSGYWIVVQFLNSPECDQTGVSALHWFGRREKSLEPSDGGSLVKQYVL